MSNWLRVDRGDAPLVLSFPHTGTDIPAELEPRLASRWLSRKDTDWWIDQLYDFASALGATMVHTSISRTFIDVNRDPAGVSLYPGQATTELCPSTTFDGEPLYKNGKPPDGAEIAERRERVFEPYHAALRAELTRLRGKHAQIALYDCHSIRSRVPRLFEGQLPVFNIGTNSGASCDPALASAIESICAASPFGHVMNGRFKGGFITRHFGDPAAGIHGVQMELACRGYMHEQPGPVGEDDWPTPYDPHFAAPMRSVLRRILQACLDHMRA